MDCFIWNNANIKQTFGKEEKIFGISLNHDYNFYLIKNTQQFMVISNNTSFPNMIKLGGACFSMFSRHVLSKAKSDYALDISIEFELNPFG